MLMTWWSDYPIIGTRMSAHATTAERKTGFAMFTRVFCTAFIFTALGAVGADARIVPARGDIPPVLKVESSCEAAGRGAIVLGRNKEACLADETTAQDTLKQNWSKYVASDKSDCLGMVTTGGPASYVELLSCVEILRDARNIRNADPLESDNKSMSPRRSRDNGRPVRIRRRHPT